MEVSLRTVTDHKLLRGLDELVAKNRHNEADLLAYIAEVDHRKLYLEQSCSSMFGYCTEVLHFSEAQASHRIHAARAARPYPVVFEKIRKGELHVAGLSLLAPVLTPENHEEVLELARHKSKRAIEVAPGGPRSEARRAGTGPAASRAQVGPRWPAAPGDRQTHARDRDQQPHARSAAFGAARAEPARRQAL